MFKQRKQYIHFFVSFCFVLLFGILLFSAADQVSAQADTFGVGTIDQNVALGHQSLTQTVVKIINIALGLLGTIALGIVLYGGFIYMTSGGNEEKVGQAKKILVNGTIGLAIILSAWTITYFVLQKLGAATGVAGMGGEGVSSRCRDAIFAQENPDICFPEADFNGGNELDCALRHRSVLLVRGITPTGGDAKAPTGMNNAKIRVLFNNPVNQNDAAQVFDIYKIENGQEVTTTASFAMQFVDSDPALVDAIFHSSDGSDRLSQGEYVVKVNKSLKTLAGNPLVEAVSCGNYPASAKFIVDTDGVVDIEPPQIGPIQLNGRPMNPLGDEYPRGKMYNYAFTAIDNSGIGLVQFHVTIRRNGEALPAFDLYDIPKVASGSKSTNENPFIAHLPLSVPANANLFDEYTIDVTVFDIDGNTAVTQIQGIVVGANCQPGDQSLECLNQNRACSSDLQCPSRKCLNNQCVEWPVITDVNPRSGIWDGAPGNYITIIGNYFGEEAGKVEFGYEKNGGIEWVLANSPVCGGSDLWHNDSIVVMVPAYGAENEENRAVIRVTKLRGAAEAVDFVDTTTDNHGPIPGPNQGRFIKNVIKRPGLCSVVVDAGNANIAEGATQAPINTVLVATGNAFGNEIGVGKIEFGSTQGEVSGWSNDSIRTRIPANIQPGITYVGVVQNNFQSNDVPFTVVSAVSENRPEIISIDPVTSTPKSFITVFGKNFGNNVGEVFLAPAADTNCRPGGALNRDCLLLNLQTCGDGAWGDTQIIGQIPGDALFKKYFVIVERNGDRVVSKGDITVGVENDAPLPGICYFSPMSGPAPLPADHPGLKFKGINFSLTPKIYFSNNKSNPQNYATWLVSQGDAVHKVVAESNAVVTTLLSTIPVSVVDGSTLTANSESVIRLQNAEGAFSNAVKYAVNDCQNSPAMPGFQCCATGPEKGFFKPEGFLCEGETREAGYAWRFTTGKIPEIPQVIEQCEKDPNKSPVFPSPAPSKDWLAPGEPACVNQSVVLAFKLPENARLVGATDPNKVKLFTCEDKDGVPDCSGNKKHQVQLDMGLHDLVLDGNGTNLTILNNPFRGPSRFLPETWYHVEISKDIESVRTVAVAGTQTEERQKLLVNRPCSDDTAYCFEFKTGTENNRCDLVRAGVIPNPFRVDYLGVLQLSGRYDGAHPLDPAEENILYYRVWGVGSQDCSLLNVQDMGWQWEPSSAGGAGSDKAVALVKEGDDSRAKVTSLQNTVPDTVPILASTHNENAELITGQSDLTIDLGAPTIIDFWPSCTESCIEAEMGARFSRQMMKNTLNAANVTLMKCNDELCEDGNGVIIPVTTSVNDYESFRFVPSNNQLLVKGVWYKVTLSSNIRGLGRLGLDSSGQPLEANDQPGKSIEPFSWRFRTTDKPDGKCVADKVVIEPRNFIARTIGERTQYNSQPRTAPNKCSRLGQNLNPWMYGWDWKTVLPQTSDVFPVGKEVASVSQYEVQGKIKPFCGINCLPNGSNISTDYNGNYPLCGNAIVDPGEDCDIAQAVEAQSVGTSCSLNCLRPGNTNRGNDVASKQCGDGVVNTDVGEECDPRDLAHGGTFCNDTCLWMGGVPEVESTTGTPWCGSGNVVFGKDCDINNTGTTTPSGKLGCSSDCLHLGTRLSTRWCLEHKDQESLDHRKIGELPECVTSVTVCGNGTLEPGEECEYFHEGNETGIYVALAEGANPVRVVTPSLVACNDRCLLGNICTLNQVPLHPDGPRCQKGTPGCSEGCYIVGSSVTYPNPSFCGDSHVGVGEHLMCENVNVAEADKLGQTPVQMVTAIGNGELIPETKSQNADVLAGITKKRDENGAIIESPEKPIGREAYALQCGFTETSEDIQGNLLANRDSNMESADTSAWDFGEGIAIEKTTEVKLTGLRSLHVHRLNDQNNTGFVAVQNIGVKKGKIYRLSFFYKIGPSIDLREPQQQGIWPYPFTTRRDMPDVENMVAENAFMVWNGPKAEMTDWIHSQRNFTVPENYDGSKPYGIGIRFAGITDVYVDDVVVEEVPPLVFESQNDCPQNTNNENGVSTNSCCYPRPNKIATYPENNASDVCQNTLVTIQVNDFIDKASLENNIMLVSRHGVNTQCGEGERDVTQDMAIIRGAQGVAVVEQGGFFHRFWVGVKQFFAEIFGLENAIAVVGEKWCGSTTSFTPSVSYESSDDMRYATSTISLALKNSLLKQTTYNVLLLGGKNGLKNSRGVGLKSADLVGSTYKLYDFFEFETGDHICKIQSISVKPGKYLFVKPNEVATFVANIISNNNSQKIQPIQNVYSWDMSWMPAKNPLFEIPVEGTPSTTETIDIKSKNLEGTLMAAAIAHVDVDVSSEDNQTGRAFSAAFELTADFCENPWPPREYFPYEDGVSFGSFRNGDFTWNNGQFIGEENIGVEVTNLPNPGENRAGSKAYFNFSFSYCADANLTGNKEDDLPYLKPLVFGNYIGGNCVDGREQLMHKPGNQQPANNGGLLPLNLQPQGFIDNTLIGCTFDIQCQEVDKQAHCRNSNVVPNNTLTEGVWKKFLFVNNKNDDAIGLQIMQNSKDLQTREPVRRTAREWYQSQFPGENLGNLRDMTIAGYDAVFDGKSYYVNALNQNGGPASNIYNNIYIFSINSNAQADTKKVFEQIMTSLKFNINVSDMGYCLAENLDAAGNLNQHQTLFDSVDRLSEITDQSCQTDFDCRDSEGLALPGTNGVCSNAKTKLLRDWKRLADVKVAQRKLEVYRQSDQHPNYPLLDAGTFIPGYTNSMWGSWNLFGSSIGGSLVDPINKWSKCGDYDDQTCWDAATSQVHCPAYTSITEYQKTVDGYQLHVPFEYFSLVAPVNPVVSEILGNDNLSKLTTEPWCRSNAVIQAEQGVCGNGIVNTGEQCDPAGRVERVGMGSFAEHYGKCKFLGNQCLVKVDCPIAIQVPGDLISGGIPRGYNQVIGLIENQYEGYCTERISEKIALAPIDNVFEPAANVLYKHIYTCATNRDCFALGSVGQGSTCVKFTEGDKFDVLNPGLITNVECVGGSPAGIRNCPQATTAPRMCNNQCQFEYGMCTGGSVCGNGRLESGEICDSGALNGTYGRCAGRQSIQGHPEMECKAYHPQYCGNGSIDRDASGRALEVCETLPDLTLVYSGNFFGRNADQSVRVSLNSILASVSRSDQEDCGISPQFVPNENQLACKQIKDYFIQKFQNFDSFKTKRCTGDHTLVCENNADCQAPTAEFLYDFVIDRVQGIQSQLFPGMMSDGAALDAAQIVVPGQKTNYGNCSNFVGLNEAYNQIQGLSCNNMCNASGEYCGDGKVTAPYEACDDQNVNNGDGCSQYCQLEGAAAAPANQPGPALACGNGRVEAGETCDMGGENGHACVPSHYGRSCSYCSADCKNVLTVDPLAFCGDNVLDLVGEKCEVIKSQNEDPVVKAVENGVAITKRCPENYRGEYSCNNSCQDVANTCVQCGRDRRGTVLAVSVLNPIVSTPANGQWDGFNKLGLYVKRDVKNVANFPETPSPLVNFTFINRFPQPEDIQAPSVRFDFGAPFRQVGGQLRNVNSYYLSEIHSSDSMDNLFEANHNYYTQFLGNDGLVSNDLCKTDYGFVANAEEGPESLSGDSNFDVGQHLMTDNADFFPLDFSKAGLRVESELVFSPAVPLNTIRVVLRAEKEVGAEETQFVGVVKNTGFAGSSEVDYMRAIKVRLPNGTEQNQICDNIISALVPEENRADSLRQRYWLPNCPDFKFKNSIFVHERQSGPVSDIQSMTIDMNGGNDGKHKTYAYYVKAVNAQEGEIPMGQLIGKKKVFVDIYVYHEGQIPRYSIYKPAYTFALAEAPVVNGNSFAEFWHVFNLEYVNGQYEIRSPRNDQGQSFERGKLATCNTDIACYVPGEVCHLEGCL